MTIKFYSIKNECILDTNPYDKKSQVNNNKIPLDKK